MYLIYFILCDISLILASTKFCYAYDTQLFPASPEEIELKLLTKETYVVPYERTKRDANSYSEPKNNSLPTIIPHLENPTLNGVNKDVHPSRNSTHSASTVSTAKKDLYMVNNTLTNVTNLPRSKYPSSLPAPLDPIFLQMNISYPEDITNETLRLHNITKRYEDSHIYYNSTRTDDPEIGKHYWVDMNNKTDVTNHSMLSHSYRRAVTVMLPFKFPFYGHEIENVTIATGGFLYTGDYIHSWLAATQYIAPLMANFDTSLSNNSFIKFVSNATAFTVLWENVSLQDQPTAGNFTFEVTLKSNGDIIFVYQHIPNITTELTDQYHPVKIGLSDAYIMDRTIFFVRRKTIYEYHRVQFDKKDLKNGTVIYLKPLPTCQSKTTCESCLAKDSGFDCQWCDNRCSNGFDRRRHDWVKKECDKKAINETKYCGLTNERIPTPGAHKAISFNEKTSQSSGSSTSAIFLTIVTIGSILSVLIWILYAYRNPHSTSGQILIRYRPSQLSVWRKGEARYTAATTIHI